MRKVNNSLIFRAGAVGINGGNNNAALRLQQVNSHPGNANNPFMYVFFAIAAEHVNLRAAELVLFGQLCQAFRYERNSGFHLDNKQSLEQVQNVATEAVHIFDELQQYAA